MHCLDRVVLSLELTISHQPYNGYMVGELRGLLSARFGLLKVVKSNSLGHVNNAVTKTGNHIKLIKLSI